jgi:hypothetical protein
MFTIYDLPTYLHVIYLPTTYPSFNYKTEENIYMNKILYLNVLPKSKYLKK